MLLFTKEKLMKKILTTVIFALLISIPAWSMDNTEPSQNQALPGSAGDRFQEERMPEERMPEERMPEERMEEPLPEYDEGADFNYENDYDYYERDESFYDQQDMDYDYYNNGSDYYEPAPYDETLDY